MGELDEDFNEDWYENMSISTDILTAAQFTRQDVLQLSGLSDAQLKNTLDRELVRLHSDHNPGTGRRRMFTGGDILKIIVAHRMSAIGFPMKWGHLVADDIERRAISRLIGLDIYVEYGFLTYPMSNGDWARVPFHDGMTEKPNLPSAYQVVEVDRLIDEVMAKLNALVADQPIPDFSVPDIEPEPNPYSPENDFFLAWTKDDQGRNVLRGLSFEETETYQGYFPKRLKNEDTSEDGKIYLELHNKHEKARLANLADTQQERYEAALKKK